MILSIKHINGGDFKPSSIIELTVESSGTVITEDVTNMNGSVDETLITSLREIADELEEQNQRIK